MFFNKNYEYGVKLLKSLELTQPVKLETVATKYSLSLHFLEQVARKMRTAGLINSVRGPGGGYVRVSAVTAKQLCVVFNTYLQSPDETVSFIESSVLEELNRIYL